MKKQKKKTFAERAKEIMKKYEKFKDDPISKKSMDLELAQLAKEQEEVRMEKEQMAYGGKVKKMSMGGPFTRLLAGYEDPELNELADIGDMAKGNNDPFSFGEGQDFGIDGGTEKSTESTSSDLAAENLLGPDKVSPAGMLGGVGSALQVFQAIKDGPEEVNYERYNPDLVDLTRSEENLKQTTNIENQNIRGGIKETSTSSGQRLANLAQAEAGRSSKLARGLKLIAEEEENTNTQIKNQAKQYNQGISMQEDMDNAKNKAMTDQIIAQGLNTMGSLYGGWRGEQNKADTVWRKNQRLVNAINSGVLEDYEIDTLLNIIGKLG